jgi:hypothetical protein
MLTQQLGLERAVPFARTQNLDLAMLTFKAFGRGAIAGIALCQFAIAVLLVAQMLGQFGAKRLLDR